ncbi:MAG: hypothetical protein IJA25_04500 [Anaerotignum sp.]|nr:hypothetical protein [Anaerotignum sp.]MBQ7103472.1 hypothetical protein [Anaerotignum sp.]
MGGFWFFILVIALIGGAAGFLAGWAKKNNRKDIMEKLIWAFWIFLTCFSFPLWSERSPLKWHDVFTFVSTYGILVAGLYGVYGEDRGPSLYPRMVLFTVIGMVCRYYLEFGEVSNTYNFTLLNIAAYLFIVPVFTLLAYEFVDRSKMKE